MSCIGEKKNLQAKGLSPWYMAWTGIVKLQNSWRWFIDNDSRKVGYSPSALYLLDRTLYWCIMGDTSLNWVHVAIPVLLYCSVSDLDSGKLGKSDCSEEKSNPRICHYKLNRCTSALLGLIKIDPVFSQKVLKSDTPTIKKLSRPRIQLSNTKKYPTFTWGITADCKRGTCTTLVFFVSNCSLWNN